MHPANLVLYAWLAVTAIVNTVARVWTPAQVDAWAERNPRLAHVALILRAGGIDPVLVIAGVYRFFAGKPSLPGFASRLGALVLVGLFARFVTACGLFPAAAATAAVATIDGAVCDLAAQQTSEPAWETFVCSVIDPATGKAAKITVRVPAAQASAFAQAHNGSLAK